MVPFYITKSVWSGGSEKLDKKKVYHDTMSVTDHAARVRKCTRQDNRILEQMRVMDGDIAASDLKRLMPDPIVSIRRSLNTLMNSGRIRKAGEKMSPRKHTEGTYVVC